MYALNPISRNVLITPDECTAKLPNSSLDSKKWIAAIEIAEIRFAEPLLGWNLYNDICNSKNIVVTSGNIATLQSLFDNQFGVNIVILKLNQIVNSIDLSTISPSYVNLWNNALYNYVFNCVYFIAMTENYANFTSSGLQKSNPIDSALGVSKTESVGISLSDLRYLNDRWLLDRINPLQDYLEKFICVNLSSYVLYSRYKCEKWNSETKNKRTSTFINIYEDDDCYNGRRSNCNNQNSIPIPSPTPVPFKQTCEIEVIIVQTPDNTLYPLCNLQTIKKQYPIGLTLTLPNLIGKNVLMSSQRLGTNPVSIPFDNTTGTFDNTTGGGFNIGDIFSFLYTETM